MTTRSYERSLLKPHRYSSYAQQLSFLVGDYLAIVLGQYLAYEVRNSLPLPHLLHSSPIYMWCIVPLVFISFLLYGDSYKYSASLTSRIKKITKSILYGLIFIIFFMYLGQVSHDVSRLYVGLSGIFILFFVFWVRYMLAKFLTKIQVLMVPAIIIGAGKTAALIEPKITKAGRYCIYGYFDDQPGHNRITRSYKCLGSFSRIEDYLKNNRIHTAFIMTPGLTGKQLVHLINQVQPYVKHVSYAPDLVGAPVGNITVEDYFDEQLVLLKVSNNLKRLSNRIIKRLFDLLLSLIGSIIIAAVGVFIATLIFIDDPGPVIYAHRRVGKNGKEFNCYKFRSMVLDSDRKLAEYLASHPEAKVEWERDFKLKDDPRVTKIGAFLRKTSLDELPQIINVLKGDMSLVGPRPITKEEVPKYGVYIKDFYMVLPGITGLWQVSGRSDTTYEERVQMDSWYVRNWSVWLDLVLLLKTFAVIKSFKGAY